MLYEARVLLFEGEGEEEEGEGEEGRRGRRR